MYRSDNREEFFTVVWGVARVREVAVQKDMIPIQGCMVQAMQILRVY